MSLVTQLVGFGLRQVIGDGADDVAQIIGVVEQRFRDHSRTLPKALEHAHNRAWQALGVALAGDGLLDRVKVFFASGDDKGVREQVQVFLKSNAVSFDGTPVEFRQVCLDELKRLRKSGLLSTSGGSAADIARQAAWFKRHTDPQGLIEESRRAVAGVADALAGGYPNLSRLLRTPTPAGPPLLAAAFCYFFRREVETDDELAHGLFFDGLRQLSAAQAKAFGEVGKALAALGGQFDALFEQLGRIESALVETRAVAVETHGAVLDLQAELQRLGGLHLANAGEIRSLVEQVLLQLGQVGMTRGEVRPGNSCSIRGEDERRAVKALLAQFRRLPAEEQRQAPALLNGLGKLQVGAGDFAEARQTFTEVVQVAGDPSDKAEASYNAYRAALEEKKWDAALAALREAGSHDPQRFAPFPLHRYEPKRILGAGGFGTAILCHDRNFDEDVVVKTLDAADLARGVDEVFREARILHRLSHAAIIGVRDCEYAEPAHKARPYIVMDHFPGPTLQQFVQERGPLNLEQLLAMAVLAAEGMRAAHAQGVLHRDLKPANLLVCKEGDLWRVKIIDFGLALRQHTVETSRVRSGASQKSALDLSVAGTLDYAPPEQLGKRPDIQPGPYSDVYAFGKLCCYALFQTTEPRNRQLKTLPEEVRELLEQCIDHDLKHRLPSFDPVLEVLGRQAQAEKEERRAESVTRAELEHQREQREAEERQRREADEQKRQREAEEQRQREEQERSEAESNRQAEVQRQRREREEAERSQLRADEQERLRRQTDEKELDKIHWLLITGSDPDDAYAEHFRQTHGISEERAEQIAAEVRQRFERERRESQEKEQRERAQLQQEGETLLAQRYEEILDRSFGKPGGEDKVALIALCRQYGIPSDQANVVLREVRTQRELARIAKKERRAGEIIANSVGMKFAWCPPGTFLTGHAQDELQPRIHGVYPHVTVVKGFWMGIHPVTRAQWQAVTGTCRWGFEGDNLPAEDISWSEAVAFCEALNGLDTKRPAGPRYVLPTEVQWEYACRAGTTAVYFFGDDPNDLGDYAWYNGNSGGQMHPVGTKKPNPWGLCDMHGSVLEWCAGSIDENQVLRGGSRLDGPWLCRAAYRRGNALGPSHNIVGCRVALCLD